MAKLTAKARKKLKPAKQLAKGHLTPTQASEIKHKADMVLGKNDSTYHSVGC
jgi:hypothetical protein